MLGLANHCPPLISRSMVVAAPPVPELVRYMRIAPPAPPPPTIASDHTLQSKYLTLIRLGTEPPPGNTFSTPLLALVTLLETATLLPAQRRVHRTKVRSTHEELLLGPKAVNVRSTTPWKVHSENTRCPKYPPLPPLMLIRGLASLL